MGKGKSILALIAAVLLGIAGGCGLAMSGDYNLVVRLLASAFLLVPAFFLSKYGFGKLRVGEGSRASAVRTWAAWGAAKQALSVLLVCALVGVGVGFDDQTKANATADKAAQEQLAEEAAVDDVSVQEKAPSASASADKKSGNTSGSAASAPSAVKGTLKVHFLNVGQGDSEFLELPDGKTMLIDAGTADAASAVVGYVQNLGYSTIDYVVATHPHADHIGGMAAVFGAFKVGEVWAPRKSHDTKTFEDFLDAVAAQGLSINAATAGKKMLSANGCEVAILSPKEGASYDDLNDWSAILKITFGSQTFLFTGDASSSVISGANAGHLDVLKVGHHGSKTSTTNSLVAALQPKFAVIEVGAGNSYGHPTSQALNALANNGVTVYRTDTDGTCVATCDGSTTTWDTGIAMPYSAASAAAASQSGSSSASKSEASASSASQGGGAGSSGQSSGGSGDAVVYKTRTGECYHRAGCSSLKKSSFETTVAAAKAEGLRPCKNCKPPE